MAGFMPSVKYPQPVGFKAGSVTVGTTLVQLPNYKIAPGHYVVLQADVNNTDDIWIGDSNVTVGSGAQIAPGAGLMVAIDNLSKLYAISGTAGQVLYYAVEVTG